MHLALLHGRRARGGIGDEAGHDAIQIRLRRLPVLVIPIEPDELPLVPLHELEGPGTHGLVGIRGTLRILPFEEVLGEHGRLIARERAQDIGRGLIQLEHGGRLVRRLDVDQGAEGIGPPRMHLLQHLHHRELHVGAGEGLAVVKAHPAAQLEGDALAVSSRLPRLRQARHGVQVEVVLEQPVVNLGRHLPDRPRRGQVRGQGRRLGLHQHDEGATALGLRLGFPRRRGGQAGEERDAHDDDHAEMPAHCAPPLEGGRRC